MERKHTCDLRMFFSFKRPIFLTVQEKGSANLSSRISLIGDPKRLVCKSVAAVQKHVAVNKSSIVSVYHI